MLISDAYRAEQAQLHADRPDYGVASLSHAPIVGRMINQLGIQTVLDYGAGKGRLAQALQAHQFDHDVSLAMFEPAIPAWAEDPEPAQMVCCIDVLEHIEPECLEAVLDHLRDLTQRVLYCTVHIGPAKKFLSDGRNAHLTQQPAAWWVPKFLDRFELSSFRRMPSGFVVVAEPVKRRIHLVTP